MILWLDTETYSECDLLKHGTARYAEDPSTEITVAQWAIDDGQPHVEDIALNGEPSGTLQALLADPDVIVAAHNVFFDRTILRHCWGIDVPVERWYDVMVQALTHGLPGALGKIGPVMGLPDDQQKDKRGRELIQLFCKPRPKGHKLRRATRETHPVEWAEFLEYSRQDITAMRAVSKAMPTWNYNRETPNGRRNTRIWQIDQRINDRGILIDLDLAHAAIKATDQEKGRLKQEMVEATDGHVTNASRRDQLLGYILAEHGVLLPDMRADTLRRRMEDPELPEAVKLLLSIRLEATKTSTAKYKAMVDTVCADGRIKGTMQFAGAQRTGRFAHRMVQPGNMKRPDMPGWEIELGIEALKHGTQRFLVDDVMNLCSNAVRGAIVAPAGKKLDVADLSNIEGRFLAFLAGEEWKLQAFRDYDAGKGPDLYVAAYARSFNVEHKTVDKTQRQIGKVQELGLGYQGGVAAFLTFAAVYNMDLQVLADAVWATASAEALTDAQGWWRWAEKKDRTLGLSMEVYVACQVLVSAWREAHPATVKLWNDANEQVKLAIENPGVTFHVGEHVKVQRDGAWLRCRLPSGRYLCYLQPKVDGDGISYMGVDQYTRQWKRIRTYGGKLVENWTQGGALDVLTENMEQAESEGYEIVLDVHDELVTETPDTPDFTSDRLAAIMATVPRWAPGLPLAAAGFETDRYKKE